MSTQGADIHYTTDGSTPSSSSATYSTPLTFTETTTLKTYVGNSNGSNIQTFTYTKNSGGDVKPVVTASPAGGEFTGSVSVTLSVNPAGVPIHYSTSGTATASSPVYSSALTFTETTTLSTYVENGAGSNTQSFTYTKQGGPDNTITCTMMVHSPLLRCGHGLTVILHVLQLPHGPATTWSRKTVSGTGRFLPASLSLV